MAQLVDTNILLRRRDIHHPQFRMADESITQLQSRTERLCVARQNLIEFRNVASRPLDKNGLGLSPAAADLDLDIAEREFDVLAENDLVYFVWRQLIATQGVSGKQVHDARLVAFMLVYGVTHILTFNIQDFVRYETLPAPFGGIVVIHPSSVIGAG